LLRHSGERPRPARGHAQKRHQRADSHGWEYIPSIGRAEYDVPFTLGHPAAIAPLWPLVRRGYMPVCAFAIGAMSPDFEYLWRLSTEWEWGHSPLGLVYFCLPVGLVVLALWVWVVREPVRHLLALPSARLPTFGRWWFVAGASILAGAATHIMWDGLTHGFAWAVHLFPVLRTRISAGRVDVPLFNALQHLSTTVGGLAVLAWLWHELRTGTPRRLMTAWRIVVFTVLGAVMAALAVWNAARCGTATDYSSFQIQVGRAAIGALLGLAVGLLLYGVVYRLVTVTEPPSRLTSA